MESSDALAVERTRAGDPDGFRILVQRHSRSVFRLAYRMLGNEADAEDVVQETFMRAYRQLDSYESRSAFNTWLYRIAANYALDLLRARKRLAGRYATLQEEDEIDRFESVASAEPGQDRVLYGTQIRERLDAALGELSDQERTAFLLRHFEGKSIDEIGDVLGTAASATKNSIFRAVRKLRAALEPIVGDGFHAARNG
jgi:RNA polymerase sigma-70 factor (ECF subfamily)